MYYYHIKLSKNRRRFSFWYYFLWIPFHSISKFRFFRFPFYYEIKIVIVLWLMMPATRGSSVLYRKFVHPLLVENEEHLDAYIERAKSDSYSVFKEISTVGLQYLASFVVQATAALQNVAHRSTTSVLASSVPPSTDVPVQQVKKLRSEAVVTDIDIEVEEILVEENYINNRPRRHRKRAGNEDA
jgi:hypothetical protein